MNSSIENDKIKNIAILGSTGSIGTQTLDIITENPNRFRVTALTARSNVDLLALQARKFKPDMVVIADESRLPRLKEALADTSVRVEAGAEAVAEAAALPENDVVVTAVVGYSGLIPTIRAIEAGKRIALANKETLVVAGEIITSMLRQSKADIVPVDSEHSAIFQCLEGENRKNISKLILTASGGPFRTFSAERLKNVTVEDALHHPNWNMGAKVTIDSASMMNKGFEMIEAKWLFGMDHNRIEIAVHPQSVVHSMVEFIDGSIKAQLGVPDMHIPISLALGYPDRIVSPRPGLTIEQYSSLTFERPDFARFPLLGFAFDAIAMGGNMPCILNAANEIAVEAFLNKRITFCKMPSLVEKTMQLTPFVNDISLADLVETNREARAIANELLGQL